jgi:hypothetical protein
MYFRFTPSDAADAASVPRNAPGIAAAGGGVVDGVLSDSSRWARMMWGDSLAGARWYPSTVTGCALIVTRATYDGSLAAARSASVRANGRWPRAAAVAAIAALKAVAAAVAAADS